MKFNYEDLISGDSIPVDGIGHIRSPLLRELKPTQGIGTWTYGLYLNMLVWEKDDLIKFMKISSGKRLKALVEDTRLGTFDTITLLEGSRKLLQKAMAFFMDEELVWDDKRHAFLTKSKTNGELIGSITRDNFDDVRDMMLQVNYINVGRSAKPVKHSSAKAQALWEKAQQALKEQAKKSTDDKRMHIGNIISKLCCSGMGYTLLNIYDLTIFQLYDQFFQCGYLRAIGVSEMAFSNHGGKDFDIQAWLKPITNL